jgi:quercetin dioxygenase-like cupin family protein
VRAGDTLENPVTGERIVFRKTAADTGGELLQLDVFFRPGGFVAAAHVHPKQAERFEVVSGRPWFRVGREEGRASPGDVIVVPPGVPHTWRNDTEEETHVLVDFRPALRTETFFETLIGLACAGKLSRRGWPNPLRAAVLAQAYRDEVVGAWPPLLVQWMVCALLAPIGRLLGYRALPPPAADRA